MFNRRQMKLAARARLASGGHWLAVLVCLIAGLLIGTASIPTPSFNFTGNLPGSSSTDEFPFDPSYGNESLFSEEILVFLGILMLVFFIAFAIGIVYTTFVSNVVHVGLSGWFLRYSRGEMPSVSHVFLGFRIFKQSVLSMLLRDVLTAVWSLLFLIPGIIKGYSYLLVPYIIYENPKLSPKQAIALSETMMRGWKWEAFKLEWSFFGWHLLSALTFGVLNLLFVNPYLETARAMFYDTVRYDALYVRRVITHEDVDAEYPQATETTAPSNEYEVPSNEYKAPSYDSAPVETEPAFPQPSLDIHEQDDPNDPLA